MKVRLWGLPADNDRVTEALRAAFAVVEQSADYPPRRAVGPLRRRYLEVRLDVDAEAEQQ